MTKIIAYDKSMDRYLRTSEERIRQAEEELNELLKAEIAKGKEIVWIGDLIEKVLGIPHHVSYTAGWLPNMEPNQKETS